MADLKCGCIVGVATLNLSKVRNIRNVCSWRYFSYIYMFTRVSRPGRVFCFTAGVGVRHDGFFLDSVVMRGSAAGDRSVCYLDDTQGKKGLESFCFGPGFGVVVGACLVRLAS